MPVTVGVDALYGGENQISRFISKKRISKVYLENTQFSGR
jgi:hypothetical protein